MNYRSELDYSSLSCYLSCPRKFLFKYVMHLTPEGPPSLDLIFGSCWHLGLEKAYAQIRDSAVTDPYSLAHTASEAFNHLWKLEAEGWYDPDASFPKSPARASDMYFSYFSQFAETDASCEIIAIEEPFTISLGETLLQGEPTPLPNYIGRLDMALLRNGDLEIYEHKTSKYANDITFAGYTNSLQCEGYLTAGYLYFDRLPKLIYNLALCQKTKIDFFRHLVTKKESKIDRFISELKQYAAAILEDLNRYEAAVQEEGAVSSKDRIPSFFIRRPGLSCTEYFRRCAYYDLCLMRNNPLTFSQQLPSGFTLFEWNPREHEANLRAKLGEI